MRRGLIGTALTLLTVYIMLVIAAQIFQKQLIFRPVPLKKDYAFEFEEDFHELWIPGKDSVEFNALCFKTPKDTSKGIILYFHGNADNLQRWGKMHEEFTIRGYDFFCMDYRGYGKTPGPLNEQNMYDDALVAYEYISKNYKSKDIIIYGRSLGCTVASELASKVPARMLILETPFNNIRSLFKMRFPLLPSFVKMRYHFKNDDHIKKVKYPVHIFQGTKDRIVPYKSAEQLKPFLKEGDQFITIPGGGHKNLSRYKLYQTTLESILL